MAEHFAKLNIDEIITSLLEGEVVRTRQSTYAATRTEKGGRASEMAEAQSKTPAGIASHGIPSSWILFRHRDAWVDPILAEGHCWRLNYAYPSDTWGCLNVLRSWPEARSAKVDCTSLRKEWSSLPTPACSLNRAACCFCLSPRWCSSANTAVGHLSAERERECSATFDFFDPAALLQPISTMSTDFVPCTNSYLPLQCGYTGLGKMYTYWSIRSGGCASSHGKSSSHSRFCWSSRRH